MGLYLFIIGLHDMKFRNVYNSEAHFWMSSWTCTFSGILAMVSSEVSVLLLVFMTIDRFLLIAIPFGRHSALNARDTSLTLACIWLIGIGIAVIPGKKLSTLEGIRGYIWSIWKFNGTISEKNIWPTSKMKFLPPLILLKL